MNPEFIHYFSNFFQKFRHNSLKFRPNPITLKPCDIFAKRASRLPCALVGLGGVQVQDAQPVAVVDEIADFHVAMGGVRAAKQSEESSELAEKGVKVVVFDITAVELTE